MKAELEQCSLFRGHFAKVFSAVVRPFSELIKQNRANQGRWAVEMRDCKRDVTLIPTVTELQRDFDALNKTKAIGEGIAGPELFVIAAEAMAKLYHPLFFKVAAHANKPIQWRGGMAL